MGHLHLHVAAARKDCLSTQPRGTTTGGEDGGIVDFRTLISGDATPSAVAAAADAAVAAKQDCHLPQLRLKSLQVGGYSARLLWWSRQRWSRHASPCLGYQCTAAAAGPVRQAWFRWRVPCRLPLLLLQAMQACRSTSSRSWPRPFSCPAPPPRPRLACWLTCVPAWS